MKECKNPCCKKEIREDLTYCSFSCRSYYNNKYVRSREKEKQIRKEKKIQDYLKKPKICKNCEKVVPYEKRHCMFCSRSCSATHSNRSRTPYVYKRSEQGAEKIKEANKRRSKECYINYDKSPKYCKVCKQKIPYVSRNRQTCSENCYSVLSRLLSTSNIQCGGTTNYRRYFYQGISMDSAWEVELAIWLDSKNIGWIRSKEELVFHWVDERGVRRRYHPDFYLPALGIYLDPKNSYLVKKDLYKLEYVKKHHKILLYYGDLTEIKEQVILAQNLHEV